MSNSTFIIQTSKDQQIYFTLRAANHEVVLTSELYRSLDSTHQGIASVREHAPVDDNYERLDADSGEPYFTLRASNNHVIGTSEMYASWQMRDKGIEAVKSAVVGASVVDRR
jgi:uncharacterized protein YegP (UPF0339 family)